MPCGSAPVTRLRCHVDAKRHDRTSSRCRRWDRARARRYTSIGSTWTAIYIQLVGKALLEHRAEPRLGPRISDGCEGQAGAVGSTPVMTCVLRNRVSQRRSLAPGQIQRARRRRQDQTSARRSEPAYHKLEATARSQGSKKPFPWQMALRQHGTPSPLISGYRLREKKQFPNLLEPTALTSLDDWFHTETDCPSGSLKGRGVE